jgi:hypothetical protein
VAVPAKLGLQLTPLPLHLVKTRQHVRSWGNQNDSYAIAWVFVHGGGRCLSL